MASVWPGDTSLSTAHPVSQLPGHRMELWRETPTCRRSYAHVPFHPGTGQTWFSAGKEALWEWFLVFLLCISEEKSPPNLMVQNATHWFYSWTSNLGRAQWESFASDPCGMMKDRSNGAGVPFPTEVSTLSKGSLKFLTSWQLGFK